MKRGLGPATLALALAIAAALPASGGSAARSQAVAGEFNLVMMVHQRSSTVGQLPGVRAWDGRARPGIRYAYRSIPCSGNAPVNNLASDLPSYNGRVSGSRLPASARAHPMAFRLRKRQGRWEMQGTIRFTVCKQGSGPTPTPDPVPDEAKPKIDVFFRARFKRFNAETVHYTGTFRLIGGTGRYRGLTGSGGISGYFACFGEPGCAASGNSAFQDGQMTLQGTYRDPTPQLAAG